MQTSNGRLDLAGWLGDLTAQAGFAVGRGVELADVLTPGFFQAHAEVESLDEFEAEAGVDVSDLVALAQAAADGTLDRATAALTSFTTWTAMVTAAAERWVENQVGEGPRP